MSHQSVCQRVAKEKDSGSRSGKASNAMARAYPIASDRKL